MGANDGINSLIAQDHGDTEIDSDPGDVEEAASAAGPDKGPDDAPASTGEPEGGTPEGDTDSDTTTTPVQKAGDVPASDTDTTTPEGDTPEGEADTTSEADANYRQLLREQSIELRNANARADRLEMKLKESGILSDEDIENINAEPEVDAGRQNQLEGFLENMRLSTKYEDVDDVVSQQHHDEFVDALTRSVAKEQGLAYKDAYGAVMEHIWDKQTNPYRYLYDNIKKYHPDFKGAKTATREGKRTAPNEEKTAPSISDVGGSGGATKGGWTMSKIDDMPEDELNSVPKDVYDKYLREELPK
ncbi:MAG: hypothetical protein ACWGQW_07625 [bacterium]